MYFEIKKYLPEQVLAILDLWIIIDYSLVEWKELGDEGPTNA